MKEGKNRLDLHHLRAGIHTFKTESGKPVRWIKI